MKNLAMSVDKVLMASMQFGLAKLRNARLKVAARMYRRRFEFRDSDVYVATFMKSGTTVMQVLLHNLLTEGNMDFHHIYEVSPCLEEAAAKNDLLLNFRPPRIIKTHLEYKFLPTGMKGKIICCMRDGMDVAVSLFHQYRNYGDPNLSWDRYFKSVFLCDGTMPNSSFWFQYLDDWLKNDRKLDICYIRYEDLTRSVRDATLKIADFLKVSAPPEVLARIEERCSFPYMKQIEKKFGKQPDRTVYDQFIRQGKSGLGKLEFSEEQKKVYYKFYNQFLAKYNLGYDSGISQQ